MDWNAGQVPDMSGRTVLVTGANGGLGLEAARVLAARGAHVVMACRSVDKGEAAAAAIRAARPRGDLAVASLDVADLTSVRRFAAWMQGHSGRLDVLVNNAGVMAIPFQRSVDGFEMQMASNHVGHFALAGLLWPLLAATEGSRVVAVSSIAARSGTTDFDAPAQEKGYDPWKAYNRSKLCNLMFALELQRRLARRGASTIALAAHPGASLTNLFSTPGGAIVKRLLSPLMRAFFQPADRGVLPILYAATAPGARPGGYYGPSRLNEMKGPPAAARIPRQALDEQAAARLWALSEQWTGVRFP